jgi:hypothetical protein
MDNMQNEAGRWVAADDIGNGVKVPRVKLQFGGDGTASDVDQSNPLPIAAPRLDPILWDDGAEVQDMHIYKDVEIEVVGAPSIAIAVQRSIVSNGSYPTAKGYDAQQLGVTSITTAGTYNFQGFGFFKFAGGGGSTVYIRGSN